jgi:hypothetical protein
MDPAAMVMIALAVLVAATLILWPLARALARRLEGKAGADPQLRAEVDELRARLQEMEVNQSRVSELEERLDFAERVLAQKAEPQRLPDAR